MKADTLREELMESARWIDSNYPHYASRLHPDEPLIEHSSRLELELVPELEAYNKQVDAMYAGLRTGRLLLNSSTFFNKSEGERKAILVHEIIESYGIDTLIFYAYGMGIVRPEHDYAEFVEADFRKSHGLPECEEALLDRKTKIMQGIDEFFRKFPEGRKYVGTVLNMFLLDKNHAIDETFRDMVWRECSLY